MAIIMAMERLLIMTIIMMKINMRKMSEMSLSTVSYLLLKLVE